MHFLEFFVAYVQPLLPDSVARFVVWALLTRIVRRLRGLDHPFKELRIVKRVKATVGEDGTEKGKTGAAGDTHDLSAVATQTDAANEQHYEVPTEFFTTHLGPCRKYSSCEWKTNPKVSVFSRTTPDKLIVALRLSETATFDSYHEKMEIDALLVGKGTSCRPQVLEIGNGWGSFLLYSAKKYPAIDFIGFSNSSTQRVYINDTATEMGLKNVSSITLDINDFCDDEQKRKAVFTALDASNTQTGKFFDRIFSCECLEHSRNYAKAFRAMSEVLKDEGKVFVQILCHREYTYFMNKDDWMGRNFFTGGTIPSTKFFSFFNDDLNIEDQWYLPGTEYAITLDAWLEKLKKEKHACLEIFRKNGYANPTLEYEKWRMFYMFCSESFGYNQGREWMVAYYLFGKSGAKSGAAAKMELLKKQ